MRGVLIGFGFEVPLTTWHVSGRSEPGDPEFYWSRINLAKTGSVTDELVVVYRDWFDLAEMRGPAAARFECSACPWRTGHPICCSARRTPSHPIPARIVKVCGCRPWGT